MIEAGVISIEQIGTLTDLLDRELWFSTCSGLGGTRCCEHGPQTVPPLGRLLCPTCRGGWFDDDPAPGPCSTCDDEGHIAAPSDLIADALADACRAVMDTLRAMPQDLAGKKDLADNDLVAADRARRHLTAAISALRDLTRG